MNDIIYFELNNWFCGRDYPEAEPFISWLSNDFNQSLRNKDWVKENKLVVVYGLLDMSLNYCISAPREWVEKNCPDLLSDKEYDYKVCRFSKGEETIITEHKKFSDFLRHPEEGAILPEGRCGMRFLEYNEENIGVHYQEINDYDEDEEDDEE